MATIIQRMKSDGTFRLTDISNNANVDVVTIDTVGKTCQLGGTTYTVQVVAGSGLTTNPVAGTTTSNAVTINNTSGVITTGSLTTAAGASQAITLTNSLITATSVLLVTLAGGTNTTEPVTLSAVPGAGTATITINNNHASAALNGTVKIAFLVC